MESNGYIFKIKWYIFLGFCFLSLFALSLFVYQHIFQEGGIFSVSQKSYIEIPKDKIKKTILSNGMTILVFENHSIPKVLVQIAYDIGGAVEASGEKGLAHLIEHMIFKGTDKLSESDIDSIARKYGASFNAFTSYDETSYYFEVNKDNWKPFIHILSDCMQNARFDKEHLASELKAVIAELRMYRDDYWRFAFERAMEMAFPANHPYHFPLIGFREDLASLKAEDLKKFYSKYYHPERATLFIVGDVNADEAIEVAKESFEKLENPSKTQRAQFPEIISDVTSKKSVIYRDVSSPSICYFWTIPGLKSDKKLLMEACEFILGWGEGSRLYSRLVDEEKIANNVSVSAMALYDAGLFLILVQPKEGATAKCREVVEHELLKLANIDISYREFGKLLKVKRRHFFNTLENNGSFTYKWLKSFFVTRNEFDIFEQINKFSDLTTKDISKFAHEYLDPLLMNEIQILPVPESKKAVLSLARESEDRLDEQILGAHKRTTPKEEEKFSKTLPTPKALNFSFPTPDREFKLKNGLKVLLKKNSFTPSVSANVYFVDAPYFASAKEGILLDLMMSLLLEYSKGYSKKENLSFFENEGASVSFDASGGRINSLIENFDIVFNHFTHVLTKPLFRQEDLDKLRAIFVNNFERAKDDPRQVGRRILRNVVYPNHSFNWTYEEAIDMLERIELKDIQQLHKKYISPSSFVLSVVGDFDLDTMQKYLEAKLSYWDGPEYKPISVSDSYPKGVQKDIDYYMLRDQAVLILGRPSPITLYSPDLIPLRLLNFVCLYSLGSRLYQLREETGLFYTASGAWATNATKEHGFDFVLTLLNASKINEAEKKIKDMLDEVARHGITQSELEVGRAIYLKEIIDLCESNSSLASQFAFLDASGLGFDYYDKTINILNNINLSEVNKIAKQYCGSSNMSRIRIGRISGK